VASVLIARWLGKPQSFFVKSSFVNHSKGWVNAVLFQGVLTALVDRSLAPGGNFPGALILKIVQIPPLTAAEIATVVARLSTSNQLETS